MSDPTEIEARKIASSFKPQWKPLAITVGANVLMAALLLGLPYMRGRELADTERASYARLSRCLLGGDVPPQPGLGTPSGYRDRFAQNVLYAPSDWPLRCRRELQAMAPPDAVFLWPSIKRAGADLRAVIALVDEELVALHRGRSLGHATVPMRPLDALARLQAAMTLMLQAAGTTEGMDEDAVRFTQPQKLATPARLPLNAGSTAQLSLTARGGVIEVFALDSRGLSWLRLDAGKIDRERVKRPALTRGLLVSESDVLTVSATSDERCAARDDHCSSRATGIGAYARGGGELPPLTWLAGHPAARPDRVLRVTPSTIEIVAQGEGAGDVSLRRFQRSAAAPGETAPPIAAESDVVVLRTDGSSEALLLDDAPSAVAYAYLDGDTVRAAVASSEPTRAALQLEPVTTSGPLTLASCRSGERRLLVYGSARTRNVAWISSNAAPRYASTASTRELRSPVHPEDPALDHLQVHCDTRGARLYELDADGTLWVTFCALDQPCGDAHKLAFEVSTFAAVATAKLHVLAYTGTGVDRAIRVLRLSDTGEPLGPAVPAGACFEPEGGMCGAPTLAVDGERLLLAAREGSDLLVLESNDDALHFQTLSGMKTGTAFDSTAHSPMQQHRVRKGID